MSTRLSFLTWAVFGLPLFPVSRGKSCGTFDFPLSLQNPVGKENTTINVTFDVTNFHCQRVDDIMIQVSKFEKRGKYFHHKCNIRHMNGTCNSSASLCRCLSPGRYLFTKVLDRTDNTKWRWSTQDGHIKEKIIWFNVTYPASVHRLIIEGMKDQNNTKTLSSVQIQCEWENGNPPRTLRLLDSQGNVINSTLKSGTLTHKLPFATCKDISAIRCEAEGSVRNMSATFPSECSPLFINDTIYISSSIGQNLSISGPIYSHTLSGMLCQLTKMSEACYPLQNASSDKHNQTYTCTVYQVLHPLPNPLRLEKTGAIRKTETEKCHCTLNGVVPYLNLEMFINYVNVVDFGLWSWTVKNDMGFDRSTVCIQQSSGPPILDYSLVKCVRTNVSSQFNVTFPILLDDVHITGCQMQKVQSSYCEIFCNTSYTCSVQNLSSESSFSNATESPESTVREPDPSDDKCSCSVHGTSPYLHLELDFSGVAESDRGLWRLSVLNKHGSGYTSFSIEVSEGPVLNKPMLKWIITGCICGVLIIMLILILILRKFKDWKIITDPMRIRLSRGSPRVLAWFSLLQGSKYNFIP